MEELYGLRKDDGEVIVLGDLGMMLYVNSKLKTPLTLVKVEIKYTIISNKLLPKM